MSAKIYALANQKGGVGKTTVTSGLAYALQSMGKRVLLVDNDPQANLSLCVGLSNPDELEVSLVDLLAAIIDEDQEAEFPYKKEDYVKHSNGLDIIPSNMKLADIDWKLRNDVSGQTVLSTLLEGLREDYDIILVDTNPYLGVLTINALIACDEVIIPVSPNLWSATGLSDLLSTIKKIRRRANPKIEIKGIVFTMCDERTNIFKEIESLVKDTFGSAVKIFDTKIPYTVKVSEANYASTNILERSPSSTASIAITKFAEEVVK